jgi:hypothetical protein
MIIVYQIFLSNFLKSILQKASAEFQTQNQLLYYRIIDKIR